MTRKNAHKAKFPITIDLNSGNKKTSSSILRGEVHRGSTLIKGHRPLSHRLVT